MRTELPRSPVWLEEREKTAVAEGRINATSAASMPSKVYPRPPWKSSRHWGRAIGSLSSLCKTLTPQPPSSSSAPGSRRRSREPVLHDLAALHDQLEVALLLEDGHVLQRVAVDHEQVGELASLEGPDLVLHPEELGIGPCGRDEALHRAHDLGFDLQLARLAVL